MYVEALEREALFKMFYPTQIHKPTPAQSLRQDAAFLLSVSSASRMEEYDVILAGLQGRSAVRVFPSVGYPSHRVKLMRVSNIIDC